MKEYYKNFRSKKMTVESMSCGSKCYTSCACQCTACGGNFAAAQGIFDLPNGGGADRGTLNDELAARGSFSG